MKYDFAEKVVIITGSSCGIGKAIASAFGALGAIVVVTSRTLSRAETVADHICREGGQAMPFCYDLQNSLSGKTLLKAVIQKYGRLDILINNALNRTSMAPCPFEEMGYAQVSSGIEANLTNTLDISQKAYKHLKLSQGSIINIGSAIVNRHMQGLLLYSVIKGAITQFTKSLAAEWAKDRIRINQINPGYVVTESMAERLPEKSKRETINLQLAEHHPLGRLGTVSDVANLVVFMASEQASWMTGSIIDLDGGYSRQGIEFPPPTERR